MAGSLYDKRMMGLGGGELGLATRVLRALG